MLNRSNLEQMRREALRDDWPAVRTLYVEIAVEARDMQDRCCLDALGPCIRLCDRASLVELIDELWKSTGRPGSGKEATRLEYDAPPIDGDEGA